MDAVLDTMDTGIDGWVKETGVRYRLYSRGVSRYNSGIRDVSRWVLLYSDYRWCWSTRTGLRVVRESLTLLTPRLATKNCPSHVWAVSRLSFYLVYGSSVTLAVSE
jgi:hypothetical protein